MKLIAHRGNWNGRNKELENSPEYILDAVENGYDVEIDIWGKGDQIFLGHDFAEHEIDEDFLIEIKDVAWIHAKNYGAAEWLQATPYHWFWHENDQMTLTSKGYVWCFPEVLVRGCIVNQPNIESEFWNNESWLNLDVAGICHDDIIGCQRRILGK